MLKRTFWHWFVCALSLALSLTKPALAQQGMGVLSGTVTDASTKEPVSEVLVTVTSPSLQGEQTVVTDSSGVYRIPTLPPGAYSIRLEKDSYRLYERAGIALRADTTLRVDALLLPESLKAESITFVMKPPSVDIGSSSTGQNINQEFTRRVPMAPPGGKGSGSRSFEAMAEATPGANADTFGTSINGTTSPENQYVLDGMSVNNPGNGTVGTALSMEFIKEVNVISGGYMPEYGRATGGMLNVVTKSGSNEFHGGAFAYYSPGALEGKRTLVRSAGQTIGTDTTLSYIGDVGADIGGPIIKDKLWFYVGFDVASTRFNLRRTLNQTRLNADGTVDRGAASRGEQDFIPGSESRWVAELRQIQAMGKLTYAVNQDNQLALALYTTPTTTGGNGKYAIDPRTGQPETDPRTTQGLNGPFETLATRRIGTSVDTSLKWTSAFNNKRVLLDTTLGWHHETGGILPSDGAEPGSGTGLAAIPRVFWRRNSNPGFHSITDFESVPAGYCTLPGQCPVATYNNGGPDFSNRQIFNRYQGRSVLTLLLQGAGHHVIKAGVDVEMTTYDNTKAYSGTVRYRETTNGVGFTWNRVYGFLQGPDDTIILGKISTQTRSVIAGGFLQDSWSVMDKVTVNAGLRYDAQFLYDTYGNRGLSLPNQWSPRAGIIYDPSQAGRAKVFANYARFYESVPLDMADRALSGEAGVTSTQRPGCNDVVPNGPCTGPANRLPASNSPNRVWNGAGGGGSLPIDADIRPQSSDEFVAGAEYELFSDGRLGLSYTKRWMNYVIEDMSRDEGQTYFLGNPGYGNAVDFPKPVRNYDAVTLYFTKTFGDDWLAQASYTASYLRGNYAGLFRPETAQLNPNINSDFDLRSALINRTGVLPGDRTHQVKIFGAKDWNLTAEHHVTTGIALRGRSGTPTSYWGSHPLYGLDETFILPRGTGERTPWEFGTDLQLAYRFNIAKDKTVQATVDIFNLFNFQAMTRRDERYTASDVRPISNGQIGADGSIAGLVHTTDGTPFEAAERNPNFGRPLAYQPPRVFRFGIRTTF